MKQHLIKPIAVALSVALMSPAIDAAIASTRTLYVGADDTVITGRNMDWLEDLGSNLWIFPAGMKRDRAAGPKSIQWTSKYESVVSGYEAGTADGMNEKGLVANLLYLTGSDYGKPDKDRPSLTIAAWPQFVLDNYATVAEAVEALRQEPFNVLARPYRTDQRPRCTSRSPTLPAIRPFSSTSAASSRFIMANNIP